jgi:hypothetical protein
MKRSWRERERERETERKRERERERDLHSKGQRLKILQQMWKH